MMRQPNNSDPNPTQPHRRIQSNRSLDKVVPSKSNRSYANSYSNGRNHPDYSPLRKPVFDTPEPLSKAIGVDLNMKNDDINFWAR